MALVTICVTAIGTPRSKGLRQLSCRYNDLQRRKALNRDND